MQDINRQIELLSGVSAERAFAIDNENLVQKLGERAFWELAKNFYERVFNDEVSWFRNIFKGKDKQEAIQNQAEFFIQRMGGPPVYSERKGHPALAGRHMNFNMTAKAAERWLHHMEAAVQETSEIDKESAALMIDYFRHTAWFLSLRIAGGR